jgi:hypothetical protein
VLLLLVGPTLPSPLLFDELVVVAVAAEVSAVTVLLHGLPQALLLRRSRRENTVTSSATIR